MDFNRETAMRGAGTAPKGNDLYTYLNDFDPQLQRLSKLLARMTAIADHIEGSTPVQEKVGPSGAPIDHCMLGGVSRRLEMFRLLCSQLEDGADRMERIIGGLNDKPISNRIG